MNLENTVWIILYVLWAFSKCSDASTTTTQPTTSQPDGNIAFCAVLNQSWYDYDQIVKFDDVLVNEGGHLVDLQQFDVPENDTYFFSMSAAASPGDRIVYWLERGHPNAVSGITRGYNYHNGVDTMSRDMMIDLHIGDSLNMIGSIYSLYSDEQLQSSWSGFRLGKLMQDPLVAFYVGRTSSYSTVGKIPFDEIRVNIGGHWSAARDIFTAPYSGYYFFSFSTGAEWMYHKVQMMVQSYSGEARTPIELWRGSTLHSSNVDTLSRATMVYMEERDSVSIHLLGGYVGSYMPELLLTSFAGFYYKPSHGYEYAWSVHRSTNWTSTDGDNLDPVDFDIIKANLGGCYNVMSHQVLISISGIYYIHLNVGSQPFTGVEYNLVRNGEVVLNVLRTATNYEGQDTLGRAAILELDGGDTLWITASPGTAIFSQAYPLTSFTGFLLFPN